MPRAVANVAVRSISRPDRLLEASMTASGQWADDSTGSAHETGARATNRPGLSAVSATQPIACTPPAAPSRYAQAGASRGLIPNEQTERWMSDGDGPLKFQG